MSYHDRSKASQDQSDTITESAGTITSDSLAGESLAQGGDFGAGSKVAASSQPSRSTTTNNTNTSGATVLQPAADAEARQASEEWSEESQLKAGRGLAAGGGKPYNTTTGSGSNVGDAPSYVSVAGGSDKPAGSDLTEGGFDSDAPNASYTSEIGTKKDPGRAALAGFQKEAAQSGADAGSGPRQTGVTNDGQFDALGGDTSA